MSAKKGRRLAAVERLEQRVVAALAELGAGPGPLVAAVSGGPDSTALLLALHHRRAATGIELYAVHANHALRGDASLADQQFVEGLCRRLGVPLLCRQLPVHPDRTSAGAGLEETARQLRQELFGEAADRFAAQFVATAHTADDQVETIAHRIIRGTGLAGLAGIPAVRALPGGARLVRPLLGVWRREVLDYLSARRQPFCQDATNRDVRFTRNRIRHELLPYLRQHFNPQVDEAVARLGQLAAEAWVVIDQQVTKLARKAVLERTQWQIIFDAERLRRMPPLLAGELVRRTWGRQGWPLQQLGQEHLSSLAALVAGKATAADLPAGVQARLVKRRLVLQRRRQ